jgi:hypothetical protein
MSGDLACRPTSTIELAASAANPKFAHIVRQMRLRASGSKRGTSVLIGSEVRTEFGTGH